MESGSVVHVQKYSIHDGPGIRTTVFLKGCPLDCWWCHNPECQSPKPQILVVEGRCIRCGECWKVCPVGGLERPASEPREEGRACTLCGACVGACPTGAREMIGRPMTVREVLAEVLQDRIFYDESGGGVTFSGGEPLSQPAFLRGLLAACRAEGIHTAVDTCGFAPSDDLLAVARLADLFLYDLKLIDDVQHVQYTGASNAPILANLRALSEVHHNIWIRIPMIPTVNDLPEQLEALAQFAASLGGVHQVNLLPYHETGVHKFRRLGKSYRLSELERPSADDLESAARRFRAHGLKTKTGA